MLYILIIILARLPYQYMKIEKKIIWIYFYTNIIYFSSSMSNI